MLLNNKPYIIIQEIHILTRAYTVKAWNTITLETTQFETYVTSCLNVGVLQYNNVCSSNRPKQYTIGVVHSPDIKFGNLTKNTN